MTPEARLEDVFLRGLDGGIDCLSTIEREWYLIQEFIIDCEMGGLSPYFYNHLPDLPRIKTTEEAMRGHGLAQLADLLLQALELFHDYVEPVETTTWNEVMKRYDPDNRLRAIEQKIYRMDNYGLAKSTIS